MRPEKDCGFQTLLLEALYILNRHIEGLSQFKQTVQLILFLLQNKRNGKHGFNPTPTF